MSVSFKKREFFKVPVSFPVPNDKGSFDNNTFTGHFKPTSFEELKGIREMQDIDVVRDRLIGWEMTDDDTKQPVAFTPETVEAVLAIASAPYHIALAFYRAASGNKTKN